MSLVTMKRRNTCALPMASKGRPNAHGDFQETRRFHTDRSPSCTHGLSRASRQVGSPLPLIVCSISIRFSRDATPNQQRRLIDACKAYVRATQEQLVDHLDKTCPNIESYVRGTEASYLGHLGGWFTSYGTPANLELNLLELFDPY